MLAAVFKDIGKLELKELPVPKPENDGDILIKVHGTGICNEAWKKKLDRGEKPCHNFKGNTNRQIEW